MIDFIGYLNEQGLDVVSSSATHLIDERFASMGKIDEDVKCFLASQVPHSSINHYGVVLFDSSDIADAIDAFSASFFAEKLGFITIGSIESLVILVHVTMGIVLILDACDITDDGIVDRVSWGADLPLSIDNMRHIAEGHYPSLREFFRALLEGTLPKV